MDHAAPPKPVVVKDAEQANPEISKKTALDLIWAKALDQYEKDNNITRSELVLAADFGDADNGVKKATLMFETWRHPQDQKDKVITAVGGCLDWVDTAVGFMKDHVDGTYATPAKIVAGAISKMIKAAKDMSEDFNLISSTFGDIYQAIKDIGLLQDRVKVEAGVEDHFVDRLTDIFVSLFDFCSFGTKMFETSRRRRYIRALIKGRNEKIQEKCDKVTSVILLFRATVPLKILREVEDIRKDLKDLGRDFPDTFIKALQDMRLKPSDLQLLTPKNSSLEKVKKRFGIKPSGMAQIETHMKMIESHYVAGTFEWLKSNPEYKTWFKAQKTPFLCVSGPQGTGKTYFTYHCCQLIQETMKARRLAQDASKTRQNIAVAYFFFDPGRPETQTLLSALSNIIVQIASQDSKFCDSIAKEVEKNGRGEPSKSDTANTLWTDFLSGKLARTPDTSRQIFILLDGIDQMSEQDSPILLHLLQGLNCDKTAIQVMMTGYTENLKNMVLNNPCEINLLENTRLNGDIRKIIEFRINNLDNLKNFSPTGRKKILEHLDSQSQGRISFVDLTLSVMEQSLDETTALEEMKNTYKPELLYKSMIEIVVGIRSFTDQKSIETLFAWCTYAKDRLTVHQVQQIWELDPSLGEFDVQAEIQGKSKSMLYTAKQQVPDEEPDSVEPQKSSDNEWSILNPTGPDTVENEPKPFDPKLEIIEFRQPALKEHLEKIDNKLIPDPSKAKVRIFTRLCDILCDSGPAEVESRESFHKYATSYFIEHLLDIDAMTASPTQGKEVVEALSRVLRNEENVCIIFETVMKEKNDLYFRFQLYDDNHAFRRILGWAKKMSFHDDEDLSWQAQLWVDSSIQDPLKMFESLASGHIESLSKQFVAEDAWIPCRLALQALARVGPNGIDDDGMFYYADINTKAANKILDFSKDWLDESPINLARTRIALALLLNKKDDYETKAENRSMALQLYTLNTEGNDNTPGPEIFYSHVGIAEYYLHSFPDADSRTVETKEIIDARWESVMHHAKMAVEQRQDEKGALGSELDNRRCTTAFWLKAKSLQELGRDDEALVVCRQALAENELEYSAQLCKFLDMLITILGKTNEKKNYFTIMSDFQHCTLKLKTEWLLPDWVFNNPVKGNLRKAAVITGRVDVLIRLYEESIDYWYRKDWFGSQILRYELAVIYRCDARVTKMAEVTLDNIMTEVRGNMSRVDSGNIIRFMWRETVDIIFENFMTVRSRAKKESEARKLRLLINDLGPTGILEGVNLAGSYLTMAKIYYELENLTQAKEEADKAFNLCIADLQDFITYNDTNAFRLLAKTLMFAGLDLDAGIALSLQYSDVDPKRGDTTRYRIRSRSRSSSPTRSLNPTITTRKSSIAQARDETLIAPPIDTLETSKVNDKNGFIPDPKPVDKEVTETVSNGESSKDPNIVSDTTSPGLGKLSNGLTNGHEEHEIPGEEPKLSKEPITGEETKTTTVDDTKQEAPKSDDRKEWPEDLIPEDMQYIICNGLCSSPPLKNGHPSVHCLDCDDMDFCLDCHAKQVAFYTDMGEGFWFKRCWGQHQYLQRPIEDWHGVKDGIIRIGVKQKPYRLWLQAVKDKWSKKLASMTLPQKTRDDVPTRWNESGISN